MEIIITNMDGVSETRVCILRERKKVCLERINKFILED